MVRITWTIQAASDLEHINDYIAKDSLRYARIQIVRIQERVKLLKHHPKTGKIISETFFVTFFMSNPHLYSWILIS